MAFQIYILFCIVRFIIFLLMKSWHFSSIHLLHAMLYMTGSNMYNGHQFTFECCDTIYDNKTEM